MTSQLRGFPYVHFKRIRVTNVIGRANKERNEGPGLWELFSGSMHS